MFDANLDLFKTYSNQNIWYELEVWGIQQKTFTEIPEPVQLIINTTCERWAKQILSYQPTHVGISVFTHESRNWTQLLCYHIRKQNPLVQIILGGRGLNDPGTPQATFGQLCLTWELCNSYINGEAENELVKLLTDSPSVINNYDSSVIANDLDSSYFIKSDFSEYNISSNWYGGQDYVGNAMHVVDVERNMHIMTSTRGCVKTCTFCDVHLTRPKFSFRSGINVFEEIQWAIEQGYRKIAFTDDMINGNNKQFMGWLELLSEYLDKNHINDFVWTSQFGIKPMRSLPNDMFKLLATTGAELTIGVDHFSDNVLDHMKKLYTAKDIFDFFEQGNLYNIKYKLLMFIFGYPTETQQDFELLKQGITFLSKYQNQILLWDFSAGCNVPNGSALASMPGMKAGSNQVNWTYDFNKELTLDEKISRRKELDELSCQLGISARKIRTQWLRIEKWAKLI
jgi:hypothetical protein